jgi:hypothetical protein
MFVVKNSFENLDETRRDLVVGRVVQTLWTKQDEESGRLSTRHTVACDVKHFVSQAQGVVPPSHYQEHVCSYAKYEDHPAPAHSTWSASSKCEID